MSYENILLLNPSFNSKLIDLILELEHLRKRSLYGTTRPSIFFQLKWIFHLLESIWSARIEWNRTTVAEFIETKISPESQVSEEIKEIQNMEKALSYIEENIEKISINEKFIREMHTLVTNGLNPKKEWSNNPWNYRKDNVKITNSNHKPCDYTQVENYMIELIEFINSPADHKYDLIKVALAHHRFVWIHPFDNGNWRTVRLFTYAMLIKAWFNVNTGGRILNPTAIFCNDRNEYYNKLSIADSWSDVWLTSWCEYVLWWLLLEIEKIDKLLDYDYLSKSILIPTIEISLEKKLITERESNILKIAIKEWALESKHLIKMFPWKLPQERSRHIRKLRDSKLLIEEKEWAFKYVINFSNSYLLRWFIEVLDKEWFLPKNEPII